MSTTCSKGHDSEWPDWCSVCGERIAGEGADRAVAAAPDRPPPDGGTTVPAGGGPTCSNCGESAHPDDAFCENCGYDFASGTLPVVVEAAPDPTEAAAAGAPTGAGSSPSPPLHVTVTIDTDFFAATTADVELDLPDPRPDATTVTLAASRNLVGRHSASRGILPEIDVEALTADPGVSSRHLMFERTSSGLWTFSDLGSTNGTYLNADADADPVTAGTAFPVDDGLQLWLGAWTRLDLALDAATPEDPATDPSTPDADGSA